MSATNSAVSKLTPQQIESWISAYNKHFEAGEADAIGNALGKAFTTPAGTAFVEAIANACMESIEKQDVYGFAADIMTIFEIGFRCAIDVQPAEPVHQGPYEPPWFPTAYPATNHEQERPQSFRCRKLSSSS